MVYPLWIAEIYIYYRNFKLDLFVLAGGVLSFIIVVAALFGRGVIDNADWGISYLIIGFIVIGLSALGGFWLKTIAFRVDDNGECILTGLRDENLKKLGT